MRKLAKLLFSEPELGWWVRRIHIGSDIIGIFSSASLLTEEQTLLLRDIVDVCPNLEIFLVERLFPSSSSFGLVADALRRRSRKTLKVVRWRVRTDAAPKVILALDTLANLTSAHLEFAPSSSTQPTEEVKFGASSALTLRLPRLQQLLVHGCPDEFLEQAAGWDLPSLHSLSVHFEGVRDENEPEPDLLPFLHEHGIHLTLLDINGPSALPVARILDMCPNLERFAFNADWRLQDALQVITRPHLKVSHIGLHGLEYAFGTSNHDIATPATQIYRIGAHMRMRNNDVNFRMLTRSNFPYLKTISVLNRLVLSRLEENDGPGPTGEETNMMNRAMEGYNGGMIRWEMWYDTCSRWKIKLEDCTGALLGTLPRDPDESEEEEGEVEESGDEERDGQGEYRDREKLLEDRRKELQSLIHQVRTQTAEIEEDFAREEAEYEEYLAENDLYEEEDSAEYDEEEGSDLESDEEIVEEEVQPEPTPGPISMEQERILELKSLIRDCQRVVGGRPIPLKSNRAI
jgi:hypothetical protein